MEMVLEDGGRAMVALEDGDNAVALGGGIGQRLKIVMVVLDGSGSRRASGVSIIEAKGLLLQCPRQRWQDGKRVCIRCKGRTLAAVARR
jgi:hypothetical protein